MKSKITTSRELLETARKVLDGDDMESAKLREVLDLTIEAFIMAEHSRHSAPPAKVVRFPSWRFSGRLGRQV